jgi:two-component system, sensor histidine kinase and response regulator
VPGATLPSDNELSLARAVPRNEARERKAFIWAAVATVAIVLGFAAWIELQLGGERATIAIDDIGEAVAAFVAAACCAWAARRNSGRQRIGWAFLAASAAAWGAGEVVWAIYEVGLGVEVPFPSAADGGFLGAIPLAAIGILAFFTKPRGTSTRFRLWLDGAIVFTGLLFVGWVAGLDVVYEAPDTSALDKAIQMAYPISDMLIGTIVVLAIRRATGEAQGRLLLLLGGLGANALADSAFAYLNAQGAYGPIGSVLDAGWVAGYLMIGLAAIWPGSVKRRAVDDKPIDVWQLALPWVAILGAGISAIIGALLGDPLDPFLTVSAGCLAIMVMGSQVYAHSESLGLLIRSRRDAAILNDIVLYAPLGVVRIGLDMTILQANPRFAALLRRPDDEVIGALLTSYLPPDEVVRAAEDFQSLADGSASSTDSETQAMRGDGSRMWLHWSATAVRRSDGEPDYFIGMFNDTTARHESEVAAVANINVLERLNRLKSEFLTMVRHEFRTALVGIEGFSELMRDEEMLDVATVKGFATDIYNDARRLDEMLDRMLNLDGIEADTVEFHMVPIDLGAAVAEAVAVAKGSSTNHRFTTELDPDLPKVAGDATKLAQLLRILLDNAIKYSPDGGEIAVSSRTEPGQVLVSVKDHGVGMPAEFDDQLFSRYQWTADNPTTTVMGTGFGLPMARQIAEMHGGRIWFESQAGVGSAFHFSLPMQSTRVSPEEDLKTPGVDQAA